MQKIIGITSNGFGAGKDTVAAFLAFDFNYQIYGFTETILEHIYQTLMCKKFRNRNLWLQYYSEHKYEKDEQAEGFWVRKLLQGYGGFYRSIAADFWLDEWNDFIQTSDRDIAVPSVRFPNEATRIKNLGGKLIRVERPGIKVDKDPSETSMLTYPVDYTILNDGSISDLSGKVHDMMASLLIEVANIDRSSSDNTGGGANFT